MKLTIRNISRIYGYEDSRCRVLRKQGAEMAQVGTVDNATITTEDGIITAIEGKGVTDGREGQSGTDGHEGQSGTGCREERGGTDGREGVGAMGCYEGSEIDAAGGCVLPAFCDPHTHIVYAGSRDGEFRDKIEGLSYEEIARRGGGILNSADLLHNTSEDKLFRESMTRAEEIAAMGTGAVEIKSGYGLNTADELKMLRVIRRIAEASPVRVKATFLGAHAISREYVGRQDEYVSLICNEMLPNVAREGLADYVDVFCDEGFFTTRQTARILEAAARYGLEPKIHANELAVSGGVQVAVEHDALSVDHLERTTDAEIAALRGRRTMPTMLPGTSFFLGIPYGRAKDFIRAGLGLALASDYNPGSSPSGDMRFVMALGCIKMRLTPEEVFNAVTLNSAYAMGVSDCLGSVAVGKRASLIITTPLPSLAYLPYCHHTPFIRRVIL